MNSTTITAMDQVRHAYMRMASEARYRPAAPGDGRGNITVDLDSLNLDDEARKYAATWMTHDDDPEPWTGLPGHSDRVAFIYLIEAARSISGMQHAVASSLLRMALSELEATR